MEELGQKNFGRTNKQIDKRNLTVANFNIDVIILPHPTGHTAFKVWRQINGNLHGGCHFTIFLTANFYHYRFGILEDKNVIVLFLPPATKMHLAFYLSMM